MTTIPTTYQVIFRQEWQERTMLVVDEGGYRSLYFDNQMTQSRMALAQPLWLILPYTRHMLASLLFVPSPRNLFMIGLGGGSLAKFFLHHYPECRVDVVDSNPAMAGIARQFFFLPIENRLTLHCADGKEFVADMAGRGPLYDLILVDAFDHDGMSPSVYTSRFFQQIHLLLSRNGVLVLNLNRGETESYPLILAQLMESFPGLISRLPVAGPSRNEILFCHHEECSTAHLTALLQQVAEWQDLQPDLDFADFMRRVVPLKKSLGKQWLDRLYRYRERFSAP
ncbi:MAG: hypothetical protein H7836_00235 [Magnetococcus sp. YQC-3]